jgi:YD repeat-containing protein
LRLTRPSGNCTRYQHDPLGRLIAVIDPDGDTHTYSYNEKDQTCGFAHDPAGRIPARPDYYAQSHRYTFDPTGVHRGGSRTAPTTWSATGVGVSDRGRYCCMRKIRQLASEQSVQSLTGLCLPSLPVF